MTDERFNDIVSTYHAMKNIRAKHEPVWKEILRWISPNGSSFDTDTAPANRSLPDYQSKLYDKTIQVFSNTFAMGLKGYTCSSQSRFFGLVASDPEYIDDEHTSLVLQKRTSQMYQMLASTRFYKTVPTFFHSFGDFGTAVMLLGYEPEGHKFLFKTLSLGDCYLMRDQNTDEIDVLFHVDWLTKHEAVKLYGEETLSEQIRNEKDYTKAYQFIQLYCRRDAFELQNEEGFPETEWIEMAWEKDQNRPCYQGGTDYKRFMAVSFDESPDGSAYGINYPGSILAGTSRAMQRMFKDQLNASQLMTNPPIRKTPGLVANIRPGGFIDVPAGQDIAPMQLVQDVSWTNQLRSEMQALAKQVYYVDFFLMLSQYQGNVNTATLAQGLQNEQVTMMSSFLDSLLDEFFSPLVMWIYGTMEKEGLFSGDAAENLSQDVRIKMVSPLYRMQQRQELQPTEEAMNMILPLVQMAPEELMPYINFQKYCEVVRDKTYADMEIIRSSEDVQRIQAASAEAKAAAIRQEQDIAQQDADSRSISALANAERSRQDSQPAESGGGQPAAQQGRFAGLRLRS